MFLIFGCVQQSIDESTGASDFEQNTNFDTNSDIDNSTFQNDSNLNDYDNLTTNESFNQSFNDSNSNSSDNVNSNIFENESTVVDSLINSSQNTGNKSMETNMSLELDSDKNSVQAIIDESDGRFESKRCKITLDKNVISGAQTVWVNIHTYSPSGEITTFLCGDSQKLQGSGGLIRDETACIFDDVGITNVWLALDDHVCASAPLWIYENKLVQKDRLCKIIDYTYNVEQLQNAKNVSVSLFVGGYESSDKISVYCAKEKYDFVLSDIIGNSTSSFIKLSCTTKNLGSIDDFAVYVQGNYCGSLLQ